ncbi:MAG: ABC transporter ATP-binding protein [Acidimicrobiia bacterium]|nr:MAG: ABC transporter ATP-binding protein [Acidimicrobiia bacterium]
MFRVESQRGVRPGITDTLVTNENTGMAPTTPGTNPLLRIEHVTKRFPEVVANNDISIDVMPGEVLCLLGENGAGKTTLADMLYGVIRPDEGHIYFRGQHLDVKSPKEAIHAGIGMVHQHFELVTPMSALENIVIGTKEATWLELDETRIKLEGLCDQYGISIDLDVQVGRLSVGEQQWIEILKALYTGVDLLILDEPTAVLTPQGVDRLFAFLRELKQSGVGIVLITHKLHEVMEISDRVAVLRHGVLVDTVNTTETTSRELARLMVGRDVVLTVEKEPAQPGKPVLELDSVAAEGRALRGAVIDVSLELRKGEILGLAGVSGNGQSALFDTLVGVNPPTNGTISLDGVDITAMRPKDIAAQGLSGVPSDRIRQGLMMDSQIQENLILGKHRSSEFSNLGFLDKKATHDFADEAIEQFEITASSPRQITRVLSGGNLQKVILARELLGGSPKVLVVHQPTRGLDIGASEYVRRRLVAERDRGAAVLLISEDLDELFNVSDRIAVIYEGEIIGTVDPETTAREDVGMLMAGISQSADAAGDDEP